MTGTTIRTPTSQLISGGWAAALVLGLLPVLSTAAPDDEFRAWQKREQAAFKQFKDERDREFADFLRTQWKEFDSFRGIKRDPKPKPPVIPPAPVTVPAKPPTKPPAPPPVVVVKPPVLPPPVVPVLPPPPPVPKGKVVNIPFYGHSLDIYHDPALATRLSGMPGPDSISNYWTALGTSDYEPLLEQLRAFRKNLRLNDWAYADLVRSFARKVHPSSQNDEHLLSWFLLTKSGYQARIAYDNAHIHLFLTSDQKVYETKYLTIQGRAYYAMLAKDRGASVGRVYTYDKEYPGNVHPLDIRLTAPALTKPTLVYRELQFEYGGKRYKLKTPYDRRVVEFLDTYPQTDLDWYFASTTNETTRAALVQELRTITRGMSEQDALNLLLRFSQTAFAYKTDDAQFGFENYLFVEETLHYPYSDCEDRSVLYAWLVREVLGVEAVGLSYPGHVATAVRLKKPISGAANVIHQGKTYVVADPTYIGADVGMVMPAYANTRPQVIRIQ
jgi:hypothetical protein